MVSELEGLPRHSSGLYKEWRRAPPVQQVGRHASRNPLVATLAVLFFFSGASGLVYQVLWQRLLSLVFGVTVFATSTVLASFMAGLALGSLIAGRLAASARHPLRLLGTIEILIGLTALSTPWALDAVRVVYVALQGWLPQNLPSLTVARLACSFLILVVPTTLMGATLPIVMRSSLAQEGDVGPRLGLLYGANTAGAVIGAILTGFYLVGSIGIQASFLVAATLNVLVGSAALALSSRYPSSAPDHADAHVDEPGALPEDASPSVRSRVLIALGLSGFAALALEVIWFRLMVLFIAATTYAFTTMLATVLAGIASGSALATFLLRRHRDLVSALTAVLFITGPVVLASMAILCWTYAAGWRTGAQLQGSIVAMLPGALLMGIAFPIAARLWAGSGRHAGETARRVGVLTAVNLTGAIAGALVGGFVLLPLLGSARSLVATSALYTLSGLLLAATRRGGIRFTLVAGTALAALVVMAFALPDPFEATHRRRYPVGERLFWKEEGVQATVAVHSAPMGGHTLYLDGLHQANDAAPLVKLHRQIGLLPTVLHRDPRHALVVGLGGGVTAGAVSRHPNLSVDIVELSASVTRAAAQFRHVNYDVLMQPNVRLRIDDARNYLMVSRQKYDVITADLIQPIHVGAGKLYSREYFELARGALEEDGLMLQWIGHRPATQYKMIMRTFLSVFPETTLWIDGNLMVGAKRPLKLRAARYDDLRRDAKYSEALESIDLAGFDSLLALYTAGPEALRAFVGEGPLLTDDWPLIEFHRSLPPGDPEIDLSGLRGNVNTYVEE